MHKKAAALQKRASALLQKMRIGARRAYVLELTGTPKAGKTTTLGMLQGFFKASGFKVHILRERAGDCPLPMKGHFFFNAWTTCTMLAEVLSTFDTNVDLLILDRGFFDALIWLELQKARYQVTAREVSVFADFVLLERWRSLVDMTLVMTAQPEVALARENNSVLLPRRGSMMNERALKEFNAAVSRASRKYGSAFSLMKLDTSGSRGAHLSTLDIISKVLPRIEAWADPEILVIPRKRVERLFDGRHFLDRAEAAVALKSLVSGAQSMSRFAAEQRTDVVQLVTAGILVHDERILVLSRSSSDEKLSQYGRRLLWKGRHIENGSPFSLKRAAAQLMSRLREELHLEVTLKPEFLGLAWENAPDAAHPGSDSRHLGVMFRVLLPGPVAQTLENKEFRKAGRGHTQEGRFLSQRDIVRTASSLDLEPWSNHIVRNIEVGK